MELFPNTFSPGLTSISRLGNASHNHRVLPSYHSLQVPFSLACLLHEVVRSEGHKNLCCLMLSVVPTGWGGIRPPRTDTVCLFLLQPFLLTAPQGLFRMPAQKICPQGLERLGGATRDLQGLLPLNFLQISTHKRTLCFLYSGKSQPIFRAEKLPVVEETRLDTDIIITLGSRKGQRAGGSWRNPKWESVTLPWGEGSWRASQTRVIWS